ncbi:MAG: aldehyde dehydrogenase family protein, partial [Actinobacteria bacterium]|nr:aldehyde dehydrogenase family protein [Actinomycetota bacterium]
PLEIGFDAPLLIDGDAVWTAGEIVSVDPGDPERVICRAGRAGADEADLALATAESAQARWASTPAVERVAVLRRAAALMRERRWSLAAHEVFEAGKPWAEADADVCEAIDYLEYYGRHALRLAHGAEVEQAPGEANRYAYAARGVGVAITPWNFPLAIPTGMVAGPLAAGNAMVLKPAEQAPGMSYELVNLLLEAGLPPGVLAYLPGVGEEVGRYLVEHPAVSFVNFTGSRAVALDIVERASVHRDGQGQVKRIVAEMGGKNAIIVDDDADVDVAVPAVVTSAFGYAGQKCSACSRLIVLDAVFDETLDRLVGAARLLRIGHARDMATQVPPLIDEDALRRLHEYREVAGSEGEVVLARDDVPDGGYYVGPTVVVTEPGSRVSRDEIFGPLLTVHRVPDFDAAIEVANAGEYGLTGGVFSRSPTRIRRAAEALRVGNLYVNRPITGAVVGRQPFGGLRLSGVGSKAGGPDYLLQVVEPRVISENTIRQGFAPLDE